MASDPSRDPPPATQPDPATHHPEPVDMAEESVAGEEDPGASLDTALPPPADTGEAAKKPAP